MKIWFYKKITYYKFKKHRKNDSINNPNTNSCKYCLIENRRLLRGNKVYNYFISCGLDPLFSPYDYINRNQKLPYICPNHREVGVQYMPYSQIQTTNRCTYCGIALKGQYKKLKVEDVRQDYINVGLIPMFEEYINATTKLAYICPKHPDVIQYNLHKNVIKGAGCPICNESKGEKRISEYLLTNKIKFMPQHKFENCKDKDLLKFDFYLPEYNICCEYQGEFHYRPINICNDFIRANINFENQLRRDEIKREYCKNNNIDLLEIPYYLFDEIDDIIDNYLQVFVEL